MAIVFTKQKKKQSTLIIVLAFVVIITIIVLWQGFFEKETPAFPEEVFRPAPKEIKINFEILEHPKIKELQPFTEIEPFKEVPPTEDEPGKKIGRENPFIPY